MKHFAATLLAIAIALTVSSCGKKSPEDKAAAQLVDIYDDLGDSIESIEDADSAKAAVEKIGGLTTEFNDLIAQTKTFTENPSPGMQKKVEKAQEQLQERLSGMKDKMAENPALMMEVLPAIIKLGLSAQSAGR